MKRYYLLSIFTANLLCSLLNAEDMQLALLEMSLEDLTQIQINSTSNRYEINTQHSASPITVITREEIERHGYKSLEELLRSVVGFDTGYHQRRTLVSNRGFRQDINTNYLLLVDGHRLNESTYSGFGIAQIYPMMDNIEKVEVVRGPSSTLWGSSALNGIISITTRGAKEYNGSQREEGVAEGSMDYEFENKRTILNATYAKSTKDYDFTLSTLYFENSADLSYMYGYRVPEDVPAPMLQANYDFDPSYQIQSKLRYKDFMVNIQHTNYDNRSNGETFRYTDEQKLEDPDKYRDSDGFMELDQTWGELLYKPQITSSLSLESRLFYDYTMKTESRTFLDTSFHETTVEYIDKGFGAEAILHKYDSNYHLLAGLFGQGHNLIINDYLLPNKDKDVYDKTFAGFAEINYKGIENWLFTLGARYEYATPRGDSHSFLPRFMIYRQLNNESYIKYMYNTGSLRPTLITTRDYVVTTPAYGTFYAQGAKKSQTSSSHSLQAGYRKDGFHLTATLFYDQIKDLILWGRNTVVGYTNDGLPIQLWETNLADITQRGIELEAAWYIKESINLYATYGYAKTTYDNEDIVYDGQVITTVIEAQYTDDSMVMAGAPSQTWNLGVDIDISSNIAWNFNYHGRYGVLSINPDPDWKVYGAEHFFDTNIRILHPKLKNSEFDIYGKNLTDNRGRFPNGLSELETQIGREVGIRLKVTF